MTDVPLALAFAAGMVAAVNPCGFALLPAYLSLLVVDHTQPARWIALVRAATATLAMTAGFVLTFGVFGLLTAPLAGWLQRHLPWFTVGLGLVLVGLGGWLLAGRELPLPGLRPRRAPALSRSLPTMALFGVAYALASLACAIGPFLAIVTSSLAASTWAGLALYGAYAAGMGLIVGTAALAVASARVSLIGRLRRLAPAVSRIGGAIMVLAGAYVAYYGWYEQRVLHGDLSPDPVTNAAGHVQRSLATMLDGSHIAAALIVFGLVLALAIALGWRSGHSRNPM